MSKKQKNLEAKLDEKQDQKVDAISQGVVEQKNAQKAKVKNDKKDKKDKKKKEGKGGVVKKTKETMSELKKVTWPTFGEVVKKTSIVVAFVLIFGVFLFGVNWLLGGLVNLLIKGTFF